ncbi:hypothetical protein ACNS7O_17010 (plasmid) [Haloferacaceae archaeon DSL9]
MSRKINEYDGTVGRRGYLKSIATIGTSVGVLAGFSDRSSAEPDETTHADGRCVYLVFGADTASDGLESWVAANANDLRADPGRSSSQVIQYRDVSQLNVNQQENAVAISIDGGDAEAIQGTEQENTNTQSGFAGSITAEEATAHRTFTGVKNVYIVFAEETGCREFSGWVVGDDIYQREQSATATIEQTQEADQFNYNSQSTAVAIAEGGSCSQASQLSYQENENYQAAGAVAATIGESDDQNADTSVEQSQEVAQLNVNEQGVAVAIAVGSGSVARAKQLSHQSNLNEQVAGGAAIVFDPMSVEDALAKAEIAGDHSNGAVTHAEGGASQSNTQAASATVEQIQSVGQENINLQNAAVAVGLEDSDATARQASYQGNFNAQVAAAADVDIDSGRYEACAVLNGADIHGDESWAIAYENGDNHSEQVTDAAVDQLQLVQQLNVNEQFGAIALATNCGEALAEQLNYQANESVQVTAAVALDERGDDRGGSDETNEKKRRCA